ncbi:hypothetical protein Bca52824_028830 [Brassica carinata]|uniref:Uncharacterized protein n=1 Tax=Brassica carinata TaxID=52824 RepID=A0A8X8AQR8_BRACI|nr:hypothetical protein Bca52824_028830 [Brassica carinata]
MDLSAVSEELAEIEGQINDLFRALSNGFQKLEKIKDASRQSRQLEELTDKMRDCKSLIKDFDREVKSLESGNDASTNRMLNDRRQSMKFSNAKSISSAQYFGKENNSMDLEAKSTLKKFHGSSAISRADLFGDDDGDFLWISQLVILSTASLSRSSLTS